MSIAANDALADIRSTLMHISVERFPVFDLPDLLRAADTIEVLSFRARQCEMPNDAAELGMKLLEWNLAAPIGVISGCTMTLIHRLLGGSDAIENKMAESAGWVIYPMALSNFPGYTLANPRLIRENRIAAVAALRLLLMVLFLERMLDDYPFWK